MAPATSPVWDGRHGEAVRRRQRDRRLPADGARRPARHPAAARPALPALDARGHGPALRYAPPGDDPSDFRGRDIAVFAVHYMNVTQPTRADHIYKPGGRDAPADPTGWKPVQLVPENARPGRGGFPLAVRPGRTTRRCGSRSTRRRSTARTVTGAPSPSRADQQTRERPGRAGAAAVRACPTRPQPDRDGLLRERAAAPVPGHRPRRRLPPLRPPPAHRAGARLRPAWRPPSGRPADRFDGSDFTPRAGYDGPGQGVGNRVVPATFYGPGDGWEDRAAGLETRRRLDGLRRRAVAAAHHLPVPARRARRRSVPGHHRRWPAS